jgi:hypothetical protein
MKWTRAMKGEYRSGPYTIEQVWGREWYASGPGVDQCFPNKAAAQQACVEAAERKRGTP